MNRANDTQTQSRYLPATNLARSHSQPLTRIIPFVAADAPNELCGKAHRIGYTSVAEEKQPLYRLRISQMGRRNALLPGFFLLKDGIFVPYG